MRLRQIHILKVCLILVLTFSIFPEVVFSFGNANDKVEIVNASSEGTNSCNEHHCPIVPNRPCQHCPVCCIFSHYYVENISASIIFDINTSQPSSATEDILYKELFAKILFRPPQSIR